MRTRFRLRASFRGADRLNCPVNAWTTHINLESTTVFEGTQLQVCRMFPLGQDARTMTLSIETPERASEGLRFIPIWEVNTDGVWRSCSDPRTSFIHAWDKSKKRTRRRSTVKV